jgi:5-methylcytosine-specific restriction endonuclease McrA
MVVTSVVLAAALWERHPQAAIMIGVCAVLTVTLALFDRRGRRRPPRRRATPIRERASRSIPQDIKIAVSVRDSGRCVLCGSTEDLQYDHIFPWSRGGLTTVDNLQLLCGYHNRLKSDSLSVG